MDLAEHHDGVQGPIQLPVPTTVKPMADHLTRGRLDRGCPSQHGRGGLRPESPRMGPADQQLGGVDGSDPRLGQQDRAMAVTSWRSSAWSCRAVLSGGQDPLGGHGQGPHGGPVPHGSLGMATSPAQAATCWRHGPDGVQGVALGPVAAPGPLGPVDLDHPLAMVDQEPGQPGPIAPGPFQGPDSPAWRLLVG
jgi:hypothetical protein